MSSPFNSHFPKILGLSLLPTFLFCCIFFYTPFDYEFGFSDIISLFFTFHNPIVVHHPLGTLGTWIGRYFWDYCGLGSYVFVGVIPFIFLSQKPSYLLGIFQAFINFLGILHFLIPHVHYPLFFYRLSFPGYTSMEILGGGIWGESFYHFFEKFFNPIGTILILFCWFLGSFFLIFEKKTHRLFLSLEKKTPPVKMTPQVNSEVKTMNFSDPKEDLISLDIEKNLIMETLSSFNISGEMGASHKGPMIHMHEFKPASGLKIQKVIALQQEIGLSLGMQGINIYPHQGVIRIEVPSSHRKFVLLEDLLKSHGAQSDAALPLVLGMTQENTPLIEDLAKMPHLLIAGSTGSGKSICLHSLILSLMMLCDPKKVRFIFIDPKMLELSLYEGIGHLLSPPITEVQKSEKVLAWAINEMERRYAIFKEHKVREIKEYYNPENPLPYIVIIIDELADIMMLSQAEFEKSIQRLSQKSRAAGIHLILATQRPSTDVITGLIKSNFPCRIAFKTVSKIDSRIILDQGGAEKLLGYGDLLFLPPNGGNLIRAQGSYISASSLLHVTGVLKKTYPKDTVLKI